MSEQEKTPLIVTRGGVPYADQAEGVRQFKDACFRAADERGLQSKRDEATPTFRPMDEWDERDETVLLLVDYTDGDHALDDAEIAITIGHNNDHNVGDGERDAWQFAGWCWTHDHYVQGRGRPIGWMPLPHDLAALTSIRGEA